MSWTFLNRHKIDESRWNQVVTQHGHARMYCLSSYLDATSETWAALVYGDYKYVMPIPFKSYMFGLFKKHYIPLFIQQLGIIGPDPIPNEILSSGIAFSKSNFLQFIHPLSHENYQIIGNNIKGIKRTNFELNLNKPYPEIAAQYKLNLKRNLKSCQEQNLSFSSQGSWQELENMIKNHSKINDPTSANLTKLKSIYQINCSDFDPMIFTVEEHGKTLAICFAPKFQNRITLLVPRSSSEGRSSNAMAFLIDQIIQENSGKDIILDFEGSMIPGVANFYEQFGSTNHPYLVIN